MAISRSMAGELARLLAKAAAPVYLLDDDRRLVYCNPACAAWLELEASDLVGQTLSYHSNPAAELASSRLAGLCPPPEAFSGARLTATILCSRGDGADAKPARRRAEFIPLADDAGGWPLVLALADQVDLPDEAPPADGADATGASDPAAESRLLHERLQRLHHELRRRARMDRLIGDSPAMVRVRSQVQLAAAGTASVLIVGPPGSGRQHLARAIHYGDSSEESAGRLTPLACAAMGSELLRSTLSSLLGKSGGRAAGTLLLTDVHELPAEVQTELAGYLAANPQAVRIISTATAPLDELAAAGSFWEDLACRLSTMVIRLPPLAERRGDIPLLAQALLEELNAEGAKQLAGFTPEAFDQLAAYPWPGNIDELAAMVRAAHAKADGPLIGLPDLPERIYLAAAAARRPRRGPQPIVLEEFLDLVERQLIERALRLAKKNKTKAARLLGLTRPRLYRRMQRLKME